MVRLRGARNALVYKHGPNKGYHVNQPTVARLPYWGSLPLYRAYILPIFFGFSSKTRYKDSIHCHLDFWFLSTTFIHSYSVIPFVYIYLLPWIKLQNRAHLQIPIFTFGNSSIFSLVVPKTRTL